MPSSVYRELNRENRLELLQAFALRAEGVVLELRCAACAALFPTFVFSGDTDVVTIGLVSATCSSGNEVALSEMTNAELQDRNSGLHRFAKRISEALRREFQAVPLIHAEDRNSNLKGRSFQEFRGGYLPPLLVFSCPLCAGEAVEVARESPLEYSKKGGCVTVLGDISLG